MLTYLDGGVKRLRVYGHPLAPSPNLAPPPDIPTMPALPLTVEAFKPYGHVIQGFSLPTSSPKGNDATIANQGTAAKFNRLGKVKQTYPDGMLKRGGLYIACTRAEMQQDLRGGKKVPLMMLER